MSVTCKRRARAGVAELARAVGVRAASVIRVHVAEQDIRRASLSLDDLKALRVRSATVPVGEPARAATE